MSVKAQSQTETCNKLNTECCLEATWQLTTCFLLALYKHLVNIQTNKPLLSYTSTLNTYSIAFWHIQEWPSEQCSRVSKTNILRTETFIGRDSLKVPWRSCINHAIIINAYSLRLYRSSSLWEIRGSPDCDKTQLIVMSFFVASCADKTSLN